MINISKVIISIFLLTSSCVFGKDFKLNQFQKNYTKKHAPKLLKTYNKIKNANKRKEFAIFLLTSSTVPVSIQKDYVDGMLHLKASNIKSGIFLKGLDKKAYNFIEKSIKSFTKEKGGENFSVMFDPDIFEKLNIKKVPIMLFSLCKEYDYRPSKCEILYTIRGTANPNFFLEKIFENNEAYKTILSQTFQENPVL